MFWFCWSQCATHIRKWTALIILVDSFLQCTSHSNTPHAGGAAMYGSGMPIESKLGFNAKCHFNTLTEEAKD